jgi:hypothetical protein
MSASVNRAVWAAGIWAVTAYGVTALAGGNADLTNVLYDAAIMGGSSWGSDWLHEVTNMVPSSASSAVVCGAVFAGAQKGLRGDSNYGVNFGAAALNEFIVDWAGSASQQVAADDGVVSDDE